jgi:hypothetical protein
VILFYGIQYCDLKQQHLKVIHEIGEEKIKELLLGSKNDTEIQFINLVKSSPKDFQRAFISFCEKQEIILANSSSL